MTVDTPDKLFELAQGGDLEAFSRLVAPFQTRLLATVHLRLPRTSQGHTDAEDIVQETLIRALEALPRFEWNGERRFGAWLTTIATNLVRREFRATKPEHSLTESQLPPDADGPRPSPLRQMRQEERFERLEAALQELPEHYREVVMLARIEGLRVNEIAERIGKSPNATSMLLLRALQALRNAFGETESLSLPDRSLSKPT